MNHKRDLLHAVGAVLFARAALNNVRMHYTLREGVKLDSLKPDDVKEVIEVLIAYDKQLIVGMSSNMPIGYHPEVKQLIVRLKERFS